MYKKIDRNVLDTLIVIYNSLEECKTYTSYDQELISLSDRTTIIRSFIDNYATIYYEGLIDADKMSIDDINIHINEELNDDLIERYNLRDKDILNTLIGLYYDIDRQIEELGEQTCIEHLKGLIQRRRSLNFYIDVYARNTNPKFAKQPDMPVHEIFKTLHGIYPVPFQKKLRKIRQK